MPESAHWKVSEAMLSWEAPPAAIRTTVVIGPVVSSPLVQRSISAASLRVGMVSPAL